MAMSEHLEQPIDAPPADEAMLSDLVEDAVPEVAEQATEQAEAPAERPAGVPEKFWDGDAGQIRTDALLKSYLELERKLGSMVPLPGDDDPAGRERLRRALGVPGSADEYQIEVHDELLKPTHELNARLHEAGFTQEQAQLVFDLAADHLLPLIDEMVCMLSSRHTPDPLASQLGE